MSTDSEWSETDCREDECSYNEPHTHWFACGPYCPCGQGNRSEAAMEHTMRETFRKMDALAAKGEDTTEYREAFAAFERAILDKSRRSS